MQSRLFIYLHPSHDPCTGDDLLYIPAYYPSHDPNSDSDPLGYSILMHLSF